MSMNKIIRERKVAVLYSPGFGGGWFSWNTGCPECIFDPEIVQMVLDREQADAIEGRAREKWNQGDNHFFPGGADALQVAWLPEGVRFFIEEYDGSEAIVTEHEVKWVTA